MIYPKLQNTLFNSSKKEVLENFNVSEIEASKWYKLKYLSFDFDSLSEFEESQFLEIIFINKLINSCKNDTFFKYLLSKLQKPYSYNYNKIYFDIFEDEWKELPLVTKISDYSYEEIIDELLENSTEENKIEIISEFITELSSRLIE